MSACSDCNKSKTVSALQNEETTCDTIVNETVCVQGTVTVTPSITTGEITSFCVGNPIIGSCDGELQPSCEFTVSQVICIQIPLTFSADAEVVEDGIICGEPDIGPCEDIAGCTHTRGFFQANEEIVTELLAEAGPITLGIGDSGFSFTVETLADAQTVFTNAVPVSPNPQYDQLYAQLLTANLNVISLTQQGIEICEFALDAIAAANNLLALEEVQPNDVVSEIQEDLARFNEGDAPGCPVHCEEPILTIRKLK